MKIENILTDTDDPILGDFINGLFSLAKEKWPDIQVKSGSYSIIYLSTKGEAESVFYLDLTRRIIVLRGEQDRVRFFEPQREKSWGRLKELAEDAWSIHADSAETTIPCRAEPILL
jgi:hypothetical protein